MANLGGVHWVQLKDLATHWFLGFSASEGLARSAHRGQITFIREYVSKSSAAVNPLTITQLASL